MNRPSPHSPDRIAVIGGGIAGAAAAAALRRRLGVEVMLLESEARDGCHASGLNAGMIRQVVASDPLSALAMETAAAFARLRRRDASFPFRATGSVLFATPARGEELRGAAARAGGRIEAAGDRSGAHPGDLALLTPGDGLVAPRALLRHFLDDARAAGVELRRRRVQGLETTGGRITGVVAGDEVSRVDLVVLAAGAWSADLARDAGGQSIVLPRRRRHLVPCRVAAPPPPDAPFVWHLDDRVYVRPWTLEDGRPGLLACPGDDEDVASPVATEDFEPRRARLEDALARFAPGPEPPRLERPWAGIRTFSPDGDFVVGHDERLEGLFWLAGLGGHGVSSSWALGRLVADLVAGRDDPLGEALSPRRFSKQGIKR